MAAQVFDYASIRPKVEQALREQFPHDTIELTEGYKGRVHVLVVSSQLNGKTEGEKITPSRWITPTCSRARKASNV